jgi:hypothetical protein
MDRVAVFNWRKAQMLTLNESLFLLALDDEKGVVVPSVKDNLCTALTGACLAELASQGRIRMGAKRRLELVDATTTGDVVLNDILQVIQESERTHKLPYWLEMICGRGKKLRNHLAENLVSRGVLDQDEKHYYPHISTEEGVGVSAKVTLKNQLRAVVLAGAEPDTHTLALLSLARASKLLNLIFTDDERLAAKKAIQEKLIRAVLETPGLQMIEEISEAIATILEEASD